MRTEALSKVLEVDHDDALTVMVQCELLAVIAAPIHGRQVQAFHGLAWRSGLGRVRGEPPTSA